MKDYQTLALEHAELIGRISAIVHNDHITNDHKVLQMKDLLAERHNKRGEKTHGHQPDDQDQRR